MTEYLVYATRCQVLRAVVQAADHTEARAQAATGEDVPWQVVDEPFLNVSSAPPVPLLDLESPEALARYLGARGCVCPRCGGGNVRAENGAGVMAVAEACDDCGATWWVNYSVDALRRRHT